MRYFFYLLALIGLFFVWKIPFSSGVRAVDLDQAAQKALVSPPIQQNLSPPRSIPYQRGRLNLLASYTITARVLASETYSLDKGSEIAPIDLALGWGPMASEAVSDKLNITQGNRFYHYRWNNYPPIPPERIVDSSANVHMVPANDNIESALKSLAEGQVVTLKGYLVHYREDHSDGSWWEWRSSMTRSDSGDGACEVLYVEDVVAYR